MPATARTVAGTDAEPGAAAIERVALHGADDQRGRAGHHVVHEEHVIARATDEVLVAAHHDGGGLDGTTARPGSRSYWDARA